MTKVINFFGEPGSGKTTTALGLSYYAKLEGFSVEYVSQISRKLSYLGLLKENIRVKNLIDKVDWIVTDSPVLLSYIYADNQDVITRRHVLDFHRKLDNVNFLLERDQCRVEDKHDWIEEMLLIEKIPFIRIRRREVDKNWFYNILSMMREQFITDQCNNIHYHNKLRPDMITS